jgi:hypothetical protein
VFGGSLLLTFKKASPLQGYLLAVSSAQYAKGNIRDTVAGVREGANHRVSPAHDSVMTDTYNVQLWLQ